MKKINKFIDSPSLRAKRLVAYNAGKYKFEPPPVCSANWDSQAWMNWVIFDNEELTGFLPYVQTIIIRDGVEKVLSY